MFIDPYRFTKTAIAQVTDPYFKHVVLFVDGEGTLGTTGSAAAVDRSLHKLSPSASASAVINASAKRYGTSGIYYPNGGSFSAITTNVFQALNMGTSDWTCEMSIYKEVDWGLSGHFDLCAFHNGTWTTGACSFFIDATNSKLYFARAGYAAVELNTNPVYWNQWLDFAFVRQGGTLSAYINGSLWGSITSDGGGSFAGMSIGNGTGGFAMSSAANTSRDAFRLAHLRITRGVARTIAARNAPFDLGYTPALLNLQFEGGQGSTLYSENTSNEPSKSLVSSTGTVTLDSQGWVGRTAAFFGGAAGLQFTPISTFQLDIANWTFAGHLHVGGVPAANYALVSTLKDSPLSGWRLYYTASRELIFQTVLSDGSLINTAPLRSVPAHRWWFVTVSRVDRTLVICTDGVPVGVALLPANARFKDAVGPLYFGIEQNVSWMFSGWMDNLQMKLGQGDYQPYFSLNPAAAWPKGRAGDVFWDDVTLLLDSSLTDQSSRAHPVSNTGVVPSSTYTVNGQQMLYVASGTYAQYTTPNSDWALGTRDFSLEFDYVCQNTVSTDVGVLSSRSASSGAGLALTAAPGTLTLSPGFGATGLTISVTQNQLLHVVFARRGNYLLAWVNDVLTGFVNTGTVFNITENTDLLLGKVNWAVAQAKFYIANVRITGNRLRAWPAKRHSVPAKPQGRRMARWDTWDYGTPSASFTGSDRTFTGFGAVRANVGLNSGKWYWEVSSNGNRYPIVGVGTADAKVEGMGVYPGMDANGWGYYGLNAVKVTGGVQSAYGFAWNNTAHVVGVYLDMDAGTLGFTKNGVDMGIAFTGLQGKTVYPMAGADATSGTSNTTVNFGQLAFAFTPPAGYNAGVWEEYVQDVVTYADLEATEKDALHVGLRLTGDDNYGIGGGVPVDSGRYAMRPTTVPANIRYSAAAVKSGKTSLRLYTTGQNVQYASSTVFDLNTPRWTWRGWFYVLPDSSLALLCRRNSVAPTSGWALHYNGFRAKINGVWNDAALNWDSQVPAINSWFHLEIVKDGTTLLGFLNGRLVGRRTDVTSLDDQAYPVILGMANEVGENRFSGYINDLEFWPGAALHDGNFTPPAAAFDVTDTQFAKVMLLVHADGPHASTVVVDSSSKARVLTVGGAAALTTAQSRFGGAALQLGVGCYVQADASVDFDFGSGDVILEGFVYLTADSPPDFGPNGNRGASIMNTWNAGADTANLTGWMFQVYGDATATGLALALDSWGGGGNATLCRATIPGNLTKNAWHHAAAVVLGGIRYLFIDGVLLSSTTTTLGTGYTQLNSFGSPLRIGISQNTTYPLPLLGMVDELRITKAGQRYGIVTLPAVRPAPVYPDLSARTFTNLSTKLRVWFDASDASTLTLNGSSVTAWKEKVSGLLYTQASAGSQPQLNTTFFPGMNCVDFGITTPKWLSNATGVKHRRICSVFMVGYLNTRAAGYSGFGLMESESSTAVQVSTTSAYCEMESSTDGAFFGNFVTNGDRNVYSSRVFTKGAPFMLEFQIEVTPGASSVGANGVAAKGGGNLLTAPFQEFVTWRVVGGVDSQYVPNGAYAEIAIFEGVLTNQERNAIRNQLAAKWKLP